MPPPGPAHDPQTLRDQVRLTVAERIPIDHAERASIERFLTEYDRLADPFSEHADLVHVTGSAIVVGPRGVILLKHRRLGMWMQPGGHVEPGEAPWEAARREAIEETGLALAPAADRPALVHVDVHQAGSAHTHLDLRYVVRLENGDDADPAPPAHESQDVFWFQWADAIERAGDARLKSLLGALASELG